MVRKGLIILHSLYYILCHYITFSAIVLSVVQDHKNKMDKMRFDVWGLWPHIMGIHPWQHSLECRIGGWRQCPVYRPTAFLGTIMTRRSKWDSIYGDFDLISWEGTHENIPLNVELVTGDNVQSTGLLEKEPTIYEGPMKALLQNTQCVKGIVVTHWSYLMLLQYLNTW